MQPNRILYMFAIILGLSFFNHVSHAQNSLYNVKSQQAFSTMKTIEFTGSVADSKLSTEFQILSGSDCTGFEFETHTSINTDGDRINFRATVAPYQVMNRDLQTATLCLADDDAPIATQSFVLQGNRNIALNIAISLSIGLGAIGLLLLFEILNAKHTSNIQSDGWWNFIYAAIILLPFLYIFVQIHANAVDMLFFDDWDRHFFGNYLASSQYGIGDYINYSWVLSHEGHRIFIPALLNSLVMNLTDASTLPKYFINLGIGLILPWLFLRILRQETDNKFIIILCLIGFSFFLFNPAFQRWLQKRATSSLLTSVASVMTLCLLIIGKPNKLTFGLAIMTAMIASFSFFPGNFIWIVGFPMLWLVGYRKPVYFILWILFSASVIIPLFIDLQATFAPSRAAHSVATVYYLVGGMLSFVVMPFIDSETRGISSFITNAIIINALLCLLFTLYLVLTLPVFQLRKRMRIYFTYLLIASWPLLNALAIVFSRSGLGDGFSWANPSRYEIYAIVFWSSIFLTIAHTLPLHHSQFRRRIGYLVIFAIIANYVTAGLITKTFAQLSESSQVTRWCYLQAIPMVSECDESNVNLRRFFFDTADGDLQGAEFPKLFWLKQQHLQMVQVDKYALLPQFTGSGWEEWMLEAYTYDFTGEPIPGEVDTKLYTLAINGEKVDSIRATPNLYWEILIPENGHITFRTQAIVTTPNTDLTYKILVESISQTTNNLSVIQSMAAGNLGEPIQVSLDAFAGHKIRITLEVESDASQDFFWKLPIIYYE